MRIAWLFGTSFVFCLGNNTTWAQPVITIITPIDVIGASPLLGSGVSRDTVPAQTNVLTDHDLTRGNTAPADAVRALNEQVGGVNLDSASGNQFQPTLYYHGFAASALQGTPQGLATYVNGVRFNQAFGDTVNFDLLPSMAIDQLNLEGSNPVFGLNALGGALNIQLKNGFTYNGGEAELYGGSFGTVGGNFQYGKQAGNTSVYVAGSGLSQNGWRDLQSSQLENFYGDIGWRSNVAEIHLNVLLANSILNGPGTSPVELLAVDRQAQFTAPNKISNKFMQISLSGNFDISAENSIQANLYYNNFLQQVINGNAPNDAPCNDGSGLLCNDDDLSSTTGGAPIPAFLGSNPQAYSELDNQTTNTNGYGSSVQVTNTHDVFGLKNHLVIGVSFDRSQTMFTANSQIGGITDISREFIGPGVTINEPGTNQPVRVGISDAYYGAFVADSLSLTDRLTLTLSGRFNAAQINLNDQAGGDLTGNHYYSRFNPAGGLAFKVTPWLTTYAGYAEANRAPTPAELSCAGPNDSCSLANFFVGDPNLKQVVAHTFEVGIRGTVRRNENADKLSYNIGLFRSNLDDDILFVNSTIVNRAFFQNIGQTRRQGIDASLQYSTNRWAGYLAYTYTDATFQTGFSEAAGSNPTADDDGNLTIGRGNRLPGVPTHQGKFGVSYRLTDAWTIGGNAIVQGSAYLFGDESNTNAKIPAFVTVNLNTAYQLTPHVQLFSYVENVTNEKYYSYGTFSPTSSVFLAQAPNATNPRSYSPAAPIGAFGGVRITF